MGEKFEITPSLRGVEQNSQVVLPGQANHHGTLFGGVALQWMDIAAAIAASRFTHTPVVTAKMTEVNFLIPIQVGELAVIHAETLWHGRSSIGVKVTLYRESLNGERTVCTTADVIMIAVGDDKRPIAISR